MFCNASFPNFHWNSIFSHKADYFSNNLHDTLKNAGGSKFRITKLNSRKFTFQKQPVTGEDEVKVSVILATKYKTKAKNFIITFFYFPVSFLLYIVCCKTSNLSIFILIFFLFENFFKASKEQVTINKQYILVSRRYSGASNSKRQVEISCNSIFPRAKPS